MQFFHPFVAFGSTYSLIGFYQSFLLNVRTRKTYPYDNEVKLEEKIWNWSALYSLEEHSISTFQISVTFDKKESIWLYYH